MQQRLTLRGRGLSLSDASSAPSLCFSTGLEGSTDVEGVMPRRFNFLGGYKSSLVTGDSEGWDGSLGNVFGITSGIGDDNRR